MPREFCPYRNRELASDECLAIEAHLREREVRTALLNTQRKTVEQYQQRRIEGHLSADIRRRLLKGLNLADPMEGGFKTACPPPTSISEPDDGQVGGGEAVTPSSIVSD